MIDRFKIFYGNLSFRKKIAYALYVTNFVAILILVQLIFFQSVRLFNYNKNDIYENSIQQIKLNLENKMNSIDNNMNLLRFNTGLADFYSNPPQSPYPLFLAFKDVVDPSTDNAMTSNNLINRITFYTYQKDLSFRSNINYIPDEETPDYIQEYKFSEKPDWLFRNNKIYVYSSFPQLNYKPTIIQFELSREDLFKDLVVNNRQFVYTIQNGNQVVYQSAGIKKKNLKAEKTLSLDTKNWTMTFYISTAGISSYSLDLINWVLLFLLISILSTIILSKFFANQIYATVDELKVKVKNVSANNFNVDFFSDKKDEMGELSNYIGEMMNRIQTLIHEVYEKTIEKQESEYKSLTNQINSHFLYNTLSLMNWKALMAGQDELSAIIQTLSKYYRTTLNHGKSEISLNDEIENIIMYINLQLFVAPERFTIKYNVQYGIKDIQVINLMLQPVVENAIEHGFSDMTKGAILEVSIFTEEKYLIIEIVDNGKGISRENLNGLLSSEGKGYGLRNVHRRIQFYFGEAYGLKITSEIGKGTRVRIILPADGLPPQKKKIPKLLS